MSDVNASAAAQYFQRPADERYPTLEAMIDAAEHDKRLSKELHYNLKDLRVEVQPIQRSDEIVPDLALVSDKGRALFTHWSFGQTARMLGAPASYLRDRLDPAHAAADLTYCLQTAPVGQVANLLVRKANGTPYPVVRACSSETYGRAWDCELYSGIRDALTRHDSRWQLPPTWQGGANGPRAGAYRGDRDSFLILCNGGSIVTDPSAAGKGPDAGGMYRALLVRNSEVGASSVVIEQILYRYICGNHMIWGAVTDKIFRRRHVGDNVTRDTLREIAEIAYKYTHQSAARDEQIIRMLIDKRIATTKEGVIDELRKLGATKEQATSAYETCERTENASPDSFWGIAQGLTRDSQAGGGLYQDERYELDRLAGLVLARGAKLVAA